MTIRRRNPEYRREFFAGRVRGLAMTQDNRLHGCSVLVIEDVYVLAEHVRKLLVSEGAAVVGPYADGADAVAAADRTKPSCALVDINLGSGASFVPAKALEARGVPVAFLTGYS